MKVYYILIGVVVIIAITAPIIVFILKSKKTTSGPGHDRPGCTPSCTIGLCPPDGCGGICPCPKPAKCWKGNCCKPSCQPGDCNLADGCGGVCECPFGQSCKDNKCCTPDCTGKVCGEADGCGGVCKCPEGKECLTEAGLCCGKVIGNQCCDANGENCCIHNCPDGTCGQTSNCGVVCGCPSGLNCNTITGKCCLEISSLALPELCCHRDSTGNVVCPLSDANGNILPNMAPYASPENQAYVGVLTNNGGKNCRLINPTWGSHGMYPDTGTLTCDNSGSTSIDNTFFGGDVNGGYISPLMRPASLCTSNADCNSSSGPGNCASRTDSCKDFPIPCPIPDNYGMCG